MSETSGFPLEVPNTRFDQRNEMFKRHDLLAGEHRPDCNNCVMVCPFNKPAGRLHAAVRLCIRRAPALNRIIVWMDDLLGYGRFIPQDRKKFWES